MVNNEVETGMAIDVLPEELRYSAMHVGLSRYKKTLHQLSPHQLSESQNIARKNYDIQSKILSSSQGSRVSIQPDSVSSALQTMVAKYSGEEEFEAELMANRMTRELMMEAIDRELRVETILELVSNDAPECTETDARIYYYLHPDKFSQPETRDARHILITVNDDFPENQLQETMRRIQSVAQRVKKKPSRFSEQALKYSECPTAMNGGELGRLKKGVLFPSLDRALFAMESGSVSDVIESPMGFHVLNCTAIYPQGLVSLSEALPQIIEKITERNRINHQKNWIKSLG